MKKRNSGVVIAVVVVVLIFATLLPHRTAQQRKKVTRMNLKISEPWSATSCKLLGLDGKTHSISDARRIVYQDVDDSGRTILLPVTAFVSTATGAPWAGPQQDYYVETKSGIAGFEYLTTTLTWCDSMAKDVLETPGAKSVDDVVADFEKNVSPERLVDEYHLRFHPEKVDPKHPKRTEFRTVIPPLEASYFSAAAPGSSMGGRPRLLSVSIDQGLLRLDLSNQTGEIKPTVWVNLDTRKAVKASNYEFKMQTPSPPPGGAMPGPNERVDTKLPPFQQPPVKK